MQQVRLVFGGTRERVVGVALSLVWLTLCDRHAGARRQRVRPERARRCRYGVVGPAAGRDQIPARERGLRTEDSLQHRRQEHSRVAQAASVASLRRRSIAGGQGRYSQRVVGGARFKPAKLGSGLDGRVGSGPGRRDVTLVRQREGPGHDAIHPPDLIVSRLGLVGHRGELCDGSGQITLVYLCDSEVPAAPARIEPVTDRVGEIASLLGGRARRDRVTRRETPRRLARRGSG